MSMPWFLVFRTRPLWLGFLILSCLIPSWIPDAHANKGAKGGGPGPQGIKRHNQAVALMGQFDFSAAERLFAQLEKDYPAWREARVNRALALFSRRQEGDERQALEILSGVLKEEPGHPRAQYGAGLIQLYRGDPSAATGHFRAVLKTDPRDAHAAYYLALCLSQQGRYQEALGLYRAALEREPALRGAYQGAAQILDRLDQGEAARKMKRAHQALVRDPNSLSAEFRYTRMGPKATLQPLRQASPKPPPAPTGPLFRAARPLTWGGAEPSSTPPSGQGPLGLSVADWNQDGYPDLFLADWLPGGQTPNLLLEGTAAGGFVPTRKHPLAQVSEVNAALWGDLDNDGLLDVYLCRKGGNQLWRQVALGQWENITVGSGTQGGDLNTLGGGLFDADQDGDLDIFLVNADGPNELFSNNLNGTFRPLGAQRGIAGDGRPARQVLAADLDGDRDLDLMVLYQDPPHAVYLNDRLWNYRQAPGFEGFLATPALAVIAMDPEGDGEDKLFSLVPDGRLLRWQRDPEGRLVPRELRQFPAGDWGQLGVLDASGGGIPQLLVATQQGWTVVSQTGAILARSSGSEARWRGAWPLLLEPAAGPALVGLDQRGELTLWPPSRGRYPFLALSLSGRPEGGGAGRSNASGIGAQARLRAGNRWSLLPAAQTHSGPGQGLQPLSIGLAGAPQANLVIHWSNGVYQSVPGLRVGQPHRISEAQRPHASGPVLFAWDGEREAFVADLLGVGSLGYAVGPGEYAAVRPWENLALPEGLPKPRDDRLSLWLVNSVEKLAYLDGARLVAWDLPPGWQLVLDERMGVLAPKPTGGARFFRQEVSPQSVTNSPGEQVGGFLGQVDGQAVPPGALDPRFVGRLAQEQILTLEFAAPLDGSPGEALLVADGWVAYPYSQTLFAAWQAGADYWAPTLEARDMDGRWQVLREQFGYPAGMARRISVSLGKLPQGSQALRLRSNMAVHWDRLAVAYAEPTPAEVRRQELWPVAARVGLPGFPACEGRAGRPQCDYANRRPFADARYPAGFYTRFGDALELVRDTEGALVIIGPGEELRLDFPLPQESAPEGWTRRYVMEANGWSKDMDLYTKDGDSVAPVPGDETSERRATLHGRYNGRYQEGP